MYAVAIEGRGWGFESRYVPRYSNFGKGICLYVLSDMTLTLSKPLPSHAVILMVIITQSSKLQLVINSPKVVSSRLRLR
jgi:hypothetical protein